MESLEVSAKTAEEALELALKQLNVNRSEVEVTVLSPGRSGVLGLGAEEARVRVTVLPQPSQEIKVTTMAREVLEKLIDMMNLSATVHQMEPPPGFSGEPAPISFDVRGEDLGILIGRRGETLTSLQYLVNLILSRHFKAQTTVIVDVEGYRQRRYEALRGLAQHMADRVRATGQSVTLEPMPAAERRIVHLALASHSDIVTQSIGDGESRKVAILLKKR